MMVLGKKYDYRAMEMEDIEAVLAIEKACFPDPWTFEQFFFEYINSNRHCDVLTHKSRLVAYMIYWLVADEIHLNNIAVREDYRERGIGTFLLENLELFAREHKAAQITLEVHEKNGPALALYGSMGFEQAGRRPGYYEHDHGDAIILTKYLKKETR